jgi:RNA polymerase sigma-70 factor (ECF subfamily)
MTASKNELGSLLSSIVPKLWSFAFRLTRDERVAEQLVQQACADWLDQRCYQSDLRTPLIGILSRMQAVWLAEETPCSQQAPDQRRPCNTSSPLNSADNTGKSKLLPVDAISAIQNLSPLPRIVMLLVHAEGLTCLEAADVIGIPVVDIQRLILEARMTIGSWAELADQA